MDCIRRRLLIGQLIQQHQLLHNCDDDDDDDGFASCCFDVFNLHKSTVGQKILLFFKKQKLNSAIFDSCFRKKTQQKFPNKLEDQEKKPTDHHPVHPSFPPTVQHNHHRQMKRRISKGCFLILKNISCKNLIKEMCRTLSNEELTQILSCLQSTGNHRSVGRQTASSPSPSLSSSPSCLSSSSSLTSPSSSSPSSSSSTSSCKSQCIVIPKNTFSRLRHAGADAAMVSWFVWREDGDQGRGDEKSRSVRRLPMCAEVGGVCINPCHWTRLYGDHPPKSDGVQTTTRKWLDPWCQTVQRSFCNLNSVKSQISQSWTRINFGRQPITSSDSKCSCQKQAEDHHQQQHGEVVLEKSGNDVILHNLSDVPVFVRSPTLEKSSKLSVVRLEPLSSALIYNACLIDDVIGNMDAQERSVLTKSLIDSVLISFGKGWGERYRRSSILNCPLWMEVFFIRS